MGDFGAVTRLGRSKMDRRAKMDHKNYYVTKSIEKFDGVVQNGG